MEKTAFRLFAIMLISALLNIPALAQGGFSYIFPGITTNNSIAIGNISPQPTTATVAFYDSSGKLNSLTVELGAGRKRASRRQLSA